MGYDCEGHACTGAAPVSMLSTFWAFFIALSACGMDLAVEARISQLCHWNVFSFDYSME